MSTDRAIPVWPEEVRRYVEYRQEVAYRQLGDRMGIAGDPDIVRDRLLGGRRATAKEAPEKVRDQFGLKDQFTPQDWERVKQAIARQEAEPSLTPAPTRFEDERTYRLMNEIRVLIIERARKIGHQIDFPPFLATLPSGDVNARISVPPGSSQPVMFFEQGLVQFLLDFAALAVWVAPDLPKGDFGDAVLAGLTPRHTMPPQASMHFQQSLMSYVVSGNPASGAVVVPPPQHALFLFESLFMYMMMFVLLHELEHLRRGHLAAQDFSKDALYAREFEADLGAGALVTRLGASSGAWGLSFWACDLVLIAFNFLDRTLGFFSFGDRKLSWISQTHPEAIRRRQALHSGIGSGVPTQARAAGGNVAAMNQALFQRLWEIALSQFGTFVPLQAAGKRPSPIWSERIERSFAPAT
jgi:hypothetical protein